MNNPIRVLLCDDSAVMRRMIKHSVKGNPMLSVIGEASNGSEAVDQVAATKPDIIVMDVEMPVMDGIDAVKAIRRRGHKLPIIMFSSLTSSGAQAALDAIDAGASDFATKPTSVGNFQLAVEHVQRDLVSKIYQWTNRYPNELKRDTTECAAVRQVSAVKATSKTKVAAIAIGSSTGGPQALTKIISDLPVDLSVPVLIAQHMPPVFTGLLAERLAAQRGHKVREAVHGDELRAGEILIAPGDNHLTVRRSKNKVLVQLNQDPPENSCRPAVDPLFRSFADCFGHLCLGVVLTGMGRDGEQGAAALRGTGARVIAQDEKTSVVWGMPGNLVRCKLADKVLPLDQIANEICRAANGASPGEPTVRQRLAPIS